MYIIWLSITIEYTYLSIYSHIFICVMKMPLKYLHKCCLFLLENYVVKIIFCRYYQKNVNHVNDQTVYGRFMANFTLIGIISTQLIQHKQ